MNFDVKGKIFSILTKEGDPNSSKDDVSLCNLAEDTYCNDGETVEKKLADKNTEVEKINKDIKNLDDKKQDAATAINTGNISEQSVKHATSADSVEWTGVKNKPTTYPPSTHNHDDRYYTETEIDTKVNSIDDRLDNVEGILTSKDFLNNATFNNPTFTTDEPATTGGDKRAAQYKCDIYMNKRNIGGVRRIQAPDGEALVLAAGDGTTTSTILDLLGTSAQFRNTNGTAYIPVYGASFTNPSSKLIKKNIRDITDDEAQKILNVRIVDFDYKESFGGQKDQKGVIAEELLELFPHAVTVPEGYNEKDYDESKGLDNQILSVDYSKLVAPLIKEVQILNKRIEVLEKQLSEK